MPNKGPWARDLICVSLRVPRLRAPKGFFLPWSFLWFCSPAAVCNWNISYRCDVIKTALAPWNHLYAHIQPNVSSLPWRPRTNYTYRSMVQIWCWLSFLQGLSLPLHLPGSWLPVATSPSSRNSAQVLPRSKWGCANVCGGQPPPSIAFHEPHKPVSFLLYFCSLLVPAEVLLPPFFLDTASVSSHRYRHPNCAKLSREQLSRRATHSCF